MSLFTRSLWPQEAKAPYKRLVLALLMAPVLVAALLTLLAFLIAGMSEETREGTLSVTLDAAASMLMLATLYTATFGLVGVTLLWSLNQRGPLAWAIVGLLLGSIAGLMFGRLFMGGVDRMLLISFSLSSWLLFTMIRRIAGIRDG